MRGQGRVKDQSWLCSSYQLPSPDQRQLQALLPIGRKFEAVFFHRQCILATRWYLFGYAFYDILVSEWSKYVYASYFGYFGRVEQKPLTLEQYGLEKVGLFNKILRMSPLGQVWFFIVWEGGHQLPEAGEDQNAKDCDKVWHACYWPIGRT